MSPAVRRGIRRLGVVMALPCAAWAQQPVPLDTGIAPWVNAPGAPGRASQKLLGDKRLPSLFIERVRFPKGFSAPPHTHPIDGYVTILKGEFTVGFGTVVDSSTVVRVKAGGYIVLPAGVPHYEWFDEDTIEQVTGVGPFASTLVDMAARPATAPDTSGETIAMAYLDAVNRRDVAALTALADAAITWSMVEGDSLRVIARNAEAFGRVHRERFARVPSARAHVESINRAGAYVFLRDQVTDGAEGPRTGLAICEVRGGKLRRLWTFPPVR